MVEWIPKKNDQQVHMGNNVPFKTFCFYREDKDIGDVTPGK